jgi:hypothetical protein
MVRTPFDIPASQFLVGNSILDIPSNPSSGEVLTFGESNSLIWGGGGAALTVVAEETLSSDATNIEITGLDGDADGTYIIECFFNLSLSSSNLTFRPNNDTSNLFCQLHNGGAVADTSDWRLMTTTGATNHVYYVTIRLQATRTIGATTVYRGYHLSGERLFSTSTNSHTGGGFYTDSSANLTSLNFVHSVTDGLFTGSRVVVSKFS